MPVSADTRDALVALDRAHVWHPYTASEDHETRDPIVVGRADGAYLEDLDGRRYLDATSSWWCAALGYGHPRLLAAAKTQLERFAHVALAGTTHEPAARLAEELVAVAPRGDRTLSRVFYGDNGSTAVEIALKMAFQYWQQNGAPARRRFLSLPGAYHGDTVGAMSVGALDELGGVFAPLLFGKNDRPELREAHEWEAAVTRLEAELDAEGASVAGLIVEPLVQGAAGMRTYAPALLRRLREACDRAGTFLIADEVFTGFGRTGRMWACEHADVVPDLLCTAKGFSGGILPFSATLTTERIFDGFRGDARRALLHGHTFCGNPLGAAVAREVLAVFRDEEVLAQVARKAEMLAEAFERLGRLPGIRRARTLGLLGACDLGDEGYYGRAGRVVQAAARARGVNLRPLGDVVYVVPPLTIDDDDLDRLFRVLEASLREALTQRETTSER
ncbi:MAG: adenosylmethionine--8-amino-7-oxononanoate transaminase [Myxococcota bacterium]